MASQGTIQAKGAPAPYFMFAHSSRWLGDLRLAQRRTVAAAHGCEFIYFRDGGRWTSYFKAPVRGHAADVALVQAVAAELDRNR